MKRWTYSQMLYALRLRGICKDMTESETQVILAAEIIINERDKKHELKEVASALLEEMKRTMK